MKGPTTVFTHGGLSLHQFTPMSGAHQSVEPTGVSRCAQIAIVSHNMRSPNEKDLEPGRSS